MITLFLRFELEKILRYFKTKTLAKVITSGLFVGVFLFVGSGVFFFFMSGFRYINVEAVEDIRLALTLYIYEVFLLVLGGIIIFSSPVSAIFTLFRGDHNDWILSSPSYSLLPKVVLIRSSLHAILPFLVIFLPAVVAYERVYHVGFFALICILVSVLFFIVLMSTLALHLVLLLSYVYYKLSQTYKFLRFTFRGLIVELVVVLSLIVIKLLTIVSSIDLVKVFKADLASDVLSTVTIGEHFRFLPTHFFAMEITHFQSGEFLLALGDFSILALVTVALVLLWWYICPLFYPIWQKFQEGASRTNSQSMLQKNSIASTYYFKNGKTLALIQKEVLVATRNLKGVLWFLFLASIWLMQIGTNVILGHNIQRYEVDIADKTILLQVIQFIIAVYFISSFTLRFVFPSFSVERKTQWILASAPLSFKRLFYSKYLFYSMVFVLLGIIMNYVNLLILHVSFTNALYSMVLFVSVIIGIVTLGLSFGALFKNTETDDPEAISTSMPGLFFTALALIYGAISDGVLYYTLHSGDTIYLLGFVMITVVSIIVLLLRVPALATKSEM